MAERRVLRSLRLQVEDAQPDIRYARRKLEAQTWAKLPAFAPPPEGELVKADLKSRSFATSTARRSIRKRQSFKRWGRK